MFGRKPKIPNPKIKEFEENLKQRGLLLVNAQLFNSSIVIYNGVEFLQFAKRSGVGTIFKMAGYFTNYFYTLNGTIVRTYFESKVKQ